MTKDLGLNFKVPMELPDIGKERSLESKLLTQPWWFVRAICKNITEIDKNRVDEIVTNVAAPRDNKGKTRKITLRDLSKQEIQLIIAKLNEGKADYGEQIFSIQQKDSGIEIKIKPDLDSLSDSLLLQPWAFIRTVGELSGLDGESLNQLALATIAPKNDRGLTKQLALNLNSSAGLFDRAAEQLRVLEPILKSKGISFTLSINKNNNTIELAEIIGEPKIFFVDQGEYVISKSEVQTAGLDACVAVGISFTDGSKFLAHVDPKTNTNNMQREVQQLLQTGVQVSNAKVWYGSGMINGTGAELSKQKAGVLIESLPLTNPADFIPVAFDNDVGISQQGDFYTR